MHKESVVMGIAGVLLGLLAGWIIGSQQVPAPRVDAAAPAAQQAAGSPAPPPALDEGRAAALKSTADSNPKDAETRVRLGDLYFDSGRFEEAVKWYSSALAIEPRNVNASTDLGIAYYYMNQPDRALEQFDKSLAVDPAHSKTLLNIGIVRAFGKQDLDGAAKAWQRVLDVAPGSDEAARAKQGLDGLRSAHPGAGRGEPQKPQGSSPQ
jgi:cytochrome c-type biogenesis protein CcmH/NrfG